MADSSITLSMLAQTALALAARKNEPFDACEVASMYSLDNDVTQMRIRLFDRRMPQRFKSQPDWAYAYAEEIEADGTEKEATLSSKDLEFPIEEIRKRLTRQFGFSPAGKPRKWDREQLFEDLTQYVEKTEIPILAEFAYKTGIGRDTLYEMPELASAIKACSEKKEAALESKALEGKVNCTMAIFSLKQLGWKDTHHNEHTGKDGGPLVISNTDAEL